MRFREKIPICLNEDDYKEKWAAAQVDGSTRQPARCFNEYVGSTTEDKKEGPKRYEVP